jgi:hypothetical protein
MWTRRVLWIVVSIIAFITTGPGITHAGSVNPPVVDPLITPPAGNVAFLVAHAIGTQTYTCTGAATWSTASVPQADLFDDQGHAIGIHFAGPTWQYKDGSTVKGQKVNGVPSPTGSIAWLLLKEVSTSVGPDGERFTVVTYVQLCSGSTRRAEYRRPRPAAREPRSACPTRPTTTSIDRPGNSAEW